MVVTFSIGDCRNQDNLLRASALFLIPFDTTTGSGAIQPKKINQLIDLLEDSSNLAEAGLVLKAHGIPFTGTWDKVRERILPAVKDGKLPISALATLLRNSEEYGGQHVFVYDTTKVNASALVNDDTLKNRLTLLGREDLLSEPDLLSKAGSRALADARIETSTTGRTLV